jgi:hypothetical protein
MAQIKLNNGSGRTVKEGELVKINPKNLGSFLIASLTDFGIIGSVSANTLTGQSCMINLIGNVNWSGVMGSPDLTTKVDKVLGKGLSANDYTTLEKNKLAGLPNIIFSETEPVAPKAGTIWIDTSET